MRSDDRQWRFRFRLGLSLAALPVLALLLALGTWQIQRHFWKQALIAEMSVSSEQPACPLTASVSGVLSADGAEQLACEQYRLTGMIDPDSIFLMGSDRIAGIPGRYAMAYVSLRNEAADLTGLWVRLGFVPENKYRTLPDAVAASYRNVDASHDFVGVLKQAGWTGPAWAQPVNDPTRSLWAYVDIDQMNAYYGVETPGLPAAYLHLVDGPVFEGLSYFEPFSRLPNNHWHYALTWFSLALILSAIWFFMSREAVAPTSRNNNSTQ